MRLSASLAALHTAAFQGPYRWSEAAFEAALADERCFFAMDEAREPLTGFALGRIVVDEAELLTLVIAPAFRRQGLGRDLLNRFEGQAHLRGARAVFLEVSADNQPARALYEGSGWRLVGQRSGYYDGVDALTMRKDL